MKIHLEIIPSIQFFFDRLDSSSKRVSITPTKVNTVNLKSAHTDIKGSPTLPTVNPQAVNKNTILISTPVGQTPAQNKCPVYQLVSINIGGAVKHVLVPVQQVTKPPQQVNIVHKVVTSPNAPIKQVNTPPTNASVQLLNTPFTSQCRGLSLIKVSPPHPQTNPKTAVDPNYFSIRVNGTNNTITKVDKSDPSDQPLFKIDSVYSLNQNSDVGLNDDDDMGNKKEMTSCMTSSDSESDVIRGESHQVLVARHAVQQLMLQVRRDTGAKQTDKFTSIEGDDSVSVMTETETCSQTTIDKSKTNNKQSFSLKSLSSQFTTLLQGRGIASTFSFDEDSSNEDLSNAKVVKKNLSIVISDSSDDESEPSNVKRSIISLNEAEAISRPVFPSNPVFPEPQLITANKNEPFPFDKTNTDIEEKEKMNTTMDSHLTKGHETSLLNVGQKFSKEIKRCSVSIEKLNIGDKITVNINDLKEPQNLKRMRRKRNISWLFQENQNDFVKQNNKSKCVKGLNEKAIDDPTQLNGAETSDGDDKSKSHSQKNTDRIKERINTSVVTGCSDENVMKDMESRIVRDVTSNEADTHGAHRTVRRSDAVPTVKSTDTNGKCESTICTPTDKAKTPLNNKDKARANLHNILQNMVNHNKDRQTQSPSPLSLTGGQNGVPHQETADLKSSAQKGERLYSSADTIKRTILPDIQRPQQVIFAPVTNNCAPFSTKSKETTKEKVVQIVRPDGSREHVKLTEWLGNKSAILRESMSLIEKPTVNNVNLTPNRIIYRFTTEKSPTNVTPIVNPEIRSNITCQDGLSKVELTKKPSDNTRNRISKLKAQLAEQEKALEKIRSQRQQTRS